MMKLELVKEVNKQYGDAMTVIQAYRIGAYEVEVQTNTYQDGAEWRNIQVRKDSSARFLPDVYFDNGSENDKPDRFIIQTSGYGSMDPDGIREVIAGYEQAMAVVECLTVEFVK